MLKGEGIIRVMGDFEQNWPSYLTLLYYPLIKQEALILYQVLYSLQGREHPISMERLASLCLMNPRQFKESRETLEEFSLLKTYYDGIQQKYLFRLYPPKNANVFLRHDTMGRLLLDAVGSKRYDELCMHFALDTGSTEKMQDISKEFDTARLENWTPNQEIALMRLRPEEQVSNPMYPFNFDVFLSGMNRIFPYRLRTKENLSRIAQLASIYGINEKDMKKYVQRAVNPKTHELNMETLENFVLHNRRVSPTVKDPYSMAPIQFLLSKQNNAPLPDSDKRLIEKLCTQYNFPPDVVNVLVEYTLKKTNQSFSAAYVEKVASTWSRLDIRTREQAFHQIQSENGYVRKGKKELPDWYAKIPEEKASEESLAKALAMQKKLRGE